MKHITRWLLTLLILLASCLNVCAHDFEARNGDGVTIYYKITSNTNLTCAVTYRGNFFFSYEDEYSGKVVIPSFVNFNGNTYAVTSIGECAFERCSNLTSVEIPNSIISFESLAFYSCIGLTSMVIPNSVKTLGFAAFCGCSGLTLLEIGNSVSSIETLAFSGCTGLESLVIPNSVTSIGARAFENCNNLKFVLNLSSLNIKKGSTDNGYVSYYADVVINAKSYVDGFCFDDTEQTQLVYYSGTAESVEIPSTVTSIASNAFTNKHFKRIVIPSGVNTIGIRAFNGCEIDELVFNARKCVNIDGYNSNSSTDNVGAFGGTKIHSMVFSDGVEDVNRNIFRGAILDIPDVDYRCLRLTQSKATIERTMLETPNLTLSDNAELVTECHGKYINFNSQANKIEDYQFDGLTFDSEYKIEHGLLLNNRFMPVTLEKDAFRFKTKGIELNVKCTAATQTTLTYKASYNAGDANIDEAFWFDPKGTPLPEDKDKWDYGRRYPGTTFKIEGLKPGENYFPDMKFIIVSNAKMLEMNMPGAATKSLYLNLSAYDVTPTTITVQGEYEHGDADVTITRIQERVTRSEVEGSVMKLKDLLPDEGYTFTYNVTVGGFLFDCQTYVVTPVLKFETQPAKAMTTTVALLAAKTNLVDEVENVGFEWRRYDAPESMPSSRVEAIVIDGVLTGALGGVNPEVYYNYRPYMSCKNGEEYFGEWITFLTGDANVYFDPTVRTYAAEIIDDFSAKLSGSVVRGSAEIERQGFQYWPNTITRGYEDMQEVEVSGQRMSLVVTGLNAGTTYSYRTFVQTAKGTTYGQTEEFTTSNVTGIEHVFANEGGAHIRGSLKGQLEIAVAGSGLSRWELYNMNGLLVGNGCIEADGEFHRLDVPVTSKGLYILTVKCNDKRQSFKLQK